MIVRGAGGAAFKAKNGELVQRYSANETISANTFIEYVDEIGTMSSQTNLNTGKQYDGYSGELLAIDDEYAMWFHTSTSSYYLYVRMLKLNEDNTVTMGTDVLISSATSSGQYLLKAYKYGENNVCCMSGYNGTLYTLSYDKTALSVTSLTSAQNSTVSCVYGTTNFIQLEERKFVLIFGGGSNNRTLYGAIVNIDDSNNVTWASTTTLYGNSYTWNYIGSYNTSYKISSNKIMLVNVSNQQYLGASYVTIDGNALTAGARTMLDSSVTSINTAVAMGIKFGNSVLLFDCAASSKSSSNYSTYVYKINISGETFTSESKRELNASDYVSYGHYTTLPFKLSDNKFAYIHGEGSYYYSYITWFDSNCSVLKAREMLGSYASCRGPQAYHMAAIGDKILCIFAYDSSYYYAYYKVINAKTCLAKPAADKIDGLTVGTLTPETKGKVYELAK